MLRPKLNGFAVLGIYVSAVLANGVELDKDRALRVQIGKFTIDVPDERLEPVIKESLYNKTTLDAELTKLWNGAVDEWVAAVEATMNNSDTQMPDFNTSRDLLMSVVTESINWTTSERERYFPFLLSDANRTANENFEIDKVRWTSDYELDLTTPDIIWNFIDAIDRMTVLDYWYEQGSLLGVGRTVQCAANISHVIEIKDEWEKMGSNAATTLMALIPALLAFGCLYVPRSSEVYATSTLVGLTNALYTLGLPVRSISAITRDNQYTLSRLGSKALVQIRSFGKINEATGSAKHTSDLAGLQLLQDYSDHRDSHDPAQAALSDMQHKIVNNYQDRWHFWHLPSIIVVVAHVVMFVKAIDPLFEELGVPHFIFSCDFDWTAVYLAVSATINSVVRFIFWQKSSHEVVKAYALSEKAQKELDNIVGLKLPLQQDSISTATHLPPLYPHYVRTLFGLRDRALTTFFGKDKDENGHKFDVENVFGIELKHKGQKISIAEKEMRTRLSQPGHNDSLWTSITRRMRHLFTNFSDTIKAGFGRNSKSARRWRPVYFLIHLSTEGRSSLITLGVGLIEAALLLVLTFFFTAQWGGNLYVTIVALSLLLIFITLGRALGFVHVWISSKVRGLTVIHCDDVDEVRGVLRIICSMKGVLVEVNGATYYCGYRVDILGRNWRTFLDKYERGDFDEELRIHTSATTDADGVDPFQGLVTSTHQSQSSTGHPSPSRPSTPKQPQSSTSHPSPSRPSAPQQPQSCTGHPSPSQPSTPQQASHTTSPPISANSSTMALTQSKTSPPPSVGP